MSLKKDAIRGVTWIGAFRGITRAVSLGKTVILARLLSPSQLGVYGVAALTMSLLEVFTETGINTVLIQLKSDFAEYVNSAWVVSIIRGTFISIVMLLVSSLVSLFFNSPDSRNLILLAAAIPFVRGFINPSEIVFQKELQFNKEFIFRTSIFLVDALVSITLTLITKTPESLIWGLLAGAVCEVLLSNLLITPRPALSFASDKLKFIVKRGKWMTASGILDYLIQNGDNIVVGRLLGSQSLGFYQISYQVSTAPVTEISNILSKVTFPIFVKLSLEKDKLFKAYLKVLLIIGVLVGILSLLLVVFTGPIVFVLGQKWESIIPIIRVLAIFAFVKSLVLSSYAYFLAIERQEVVTVISLIGFVSMFAVIIPLVSTFGILGAAYAALLGSLVSIAPVVYYLRK